MKHPPVFRSARLYSCALAAVIVTHGAQASNVVYQLTVTSGNWSSNSWDPPMGAIGAGDAAMYSETVDACAITLDCPVTVGALFTGATSTKGWTIEATSGIAMTLDGTGINGSNNWFDHAGVAAIGSRGTLANLSIMPDVVLSRTDLDMGNTKSGSLTLTGDLSASSGQVITFRGGGSGVIALNGNIGAHGSRIALCNQRGSGGGDVMIAGNLGSRVTCVTQNSSGSNLILSGANTHTGGTVVCAGVLQYQSAESIGGAGRSVFVGTNGMACADYPIDQAFLDRLDSAGTGTVGIGVAGPTICPLDFTRFSGFLGTHASATYTGILTPQGTTYRLGGGGGTLTLSNSNALTGAGNSLLVRGFIASSTSSVALTNTNDMGGTVTVNANTLQISGTNGALTDVKAYDLNAGSLLVDNSGSGHNHHNRINDLADVNFGGGALIYKGYNVGSSATHSTETIGNLALLAGPQSTCTVSYGSSNTAVLSASALTRATAGLGTLLVNGIGLGKNDVAAASVARLLLGSPPPLVGTTEAISGGINPTNQDTRIVPFLVGAATSASGGLGTASGTANTFVTYHAATGLRPLNPSDELMSNAIVAGANTQIAATTTSDTTTAINSLVMNGSTLTLTDGTSLTNSSGALLFTASSTIAPSGSSGVLDFAGREAIITVNSGQTGTISASITGNGGLTKSGAGTLALTGAASALSGGITLNAGTIAWNQASVFGSNTFTIHGGTIDGIANYGFSIGNAVRIRGNFAVNNSASSEFSGPVTLAGSYGITVPGSMLIISGQIDDGGNGYGITMAGGKTLSITGENNTYTGKTIVQDATLRVATLGHAGTPDSLGNPSGSMRPIDIHSGATLQFGSADTDRLINLAGAVPGTVTVTPQSNGSGVFGGITATGSSPRTMVLVNSGNPGRLTVSGGIPDMADGSEVKLQVPFGSTHASNLVAMEGEATFSGAISIGGGGTGMFMIGGSGQLGGGSFANTIVIGSGCVLNHASSANQILSGVISGQGNLTKSGIGTLTLTGANAYGGITTVSKGKLVIQGVHGGSGAVSVSADATLGGTGTLNGGVTIAETGRLAFHIDSVAASHDPLDLAGALVFSGASVLDITASGTASGRYTLVTATGGITGSVPDTRNLPPGLEATVMISPDRSSLWLDVVSTGAADPYMTWADAQGLDGTTGKEKNADDDPDHDGRSNMVEFAFDGNPRNGSNEGKMIGSIVTLPSDGSQVFTLTLPIRRDASFSGASAQVSALIDGLVYTIQGSHTLEAASWTMAVREVTGPDATAIQAGLPGLSDLDHDLSAEWAYRTFRVPGSVGEGNRGDFLRATVTQP